MSDSPTKEQVFAVAEQILSEGGVPTPKLIAQLLTVEEAELDAHYAAWWQITMRPEQGELLSKINLPQAPESIAISFNQIWHQAVKEAYTELYPKFQALKEAEKTDNSSELQRIENQKIEVEGKLQYERTENQALSITIKALKAENLSLKEAVEYEAQQRKECEQDAKKLKDENKDILRTTKNAQASFEQRLRERERASNELVAKAETDMRYYRNQLEIKSNEMNKNETKIIKDNHDLKAEIAKRDACIEGYQTHIKSMELELKDLHQTQEKSDKSMFDSKSKSLTINNKNKRLSEEIDALKAEILSLRNKNVLMNTDTVRQANNMRTNLLEKEAKIERLRERNTSLDQRIIQLSEEIRRLKNRLQA